ncbi:MAG: Spy/CpxP family protein refolding chaperone [Tangfeifania sp.]
MKTLKIMKFTLVFLTFVLTVSTVFAQGWRGGNRAGYGQNLNQTADSTPLTCINMIQGLTEEQITEIQSLESEHQKSMGELRTERRSTVDAIEKNEIRGEMLRKVKAHREEVRNLLTEEQQQQYDLLQARNQGWRQGFAQGKRNASGRAGFKGRNSFGRGSAGAGYGRGRAENGRRNSRGGGCFYFN